MSNRRNQLGRKGAVCRSASRMIDMLEPRVHLKADGFDGGLLQHFPGVCGCPGCRPQVNSGASLADMMRGESVTNRGPVGLSKGSGASLPILSSRPLATKKLFIDFDGAAAFDWVNQDSVVERVHGAGGNDVAIPAFSIDTNTSSFNADEVSGMTAIWRHVAEKYSTFNIDVTTVDPGDYLDNISVRVIVGGSSSDWHNLPFGGVAAIGGFTTNVDNTSFMWSADAIRANSTFLNDDDRHYLGDGVAHEAGHTFGLVHQKQGNGTQFTAEYFEGDATTAPIMGSSGYQSEKYGRWWITNMTANQLSPQANQNDIVFLGQTIGYISDDHAGNTSGVPTQLVSDNAGNFTGSGVISALTDVDTFRFTSPGQFGSVTITNSAEGGMLKPLLELRTYPGNVLVSSTQSSTNRTFTISSNNLVTGQQYVAVAKNDDKWGSIGKYTIKAKVTPFAVVWSSTRTLVVSGYENANDDINVDYLFISGQWQYYVDLAFNGNTSQLAGVLIPASQVDQIFISTYSGNDTVRFLTSNIPRPVSLSMGLGTDLFLLDGSGSSANTTVNIDNDLIEFGPLDISHINDIEAVTLKSGSGVDTFNVRTWNNGSLNLDGGTQVGGSGLVDRLVYDDADETVGRPYGIVSSSIRTQPYFGGPVTTNPFAGFEIVSLNLGSGNDELLMSSISPATLLSLFVETGAGDDHVYGGSSIGLDFYTQSTNIRMGEGSDQLTLRNDASSAAAAWRFLPGIVRVDLSTPQVNVNHTGVERFEFSGGTGADWMNVPATTATDLITLKGGAGNDAYVIFDADLRRTGNIRSVITINDSSGDDTLRADNGGLADTGQIGDFLHITEGVLSHTSADRFFAPGGRVLHSGINRLDVTTSQANDSVVVAPSPNYAINIYDSNLAFSNSDNITFSLAGVNGWQYQNLFTIWRLSSLNRLNVDVAGFENPSLGDEVPQIITQPTAVFDAPAFSIGMQFSVAMDPYVFNADEAFSVQNLTTGQFVPRAFTLITGDGSDGRFSITFPGYQNGLPPDGRYRITLNADLTRSINYNPMAANVFADFSILGGDANNDARVDFNDLVLLARNFNQTQRVYSQGDFNYDGRVSFEDLVILARNFGKNLPAPVSIGTPTTRGAGQVGGAGLGAGRAKVWDDLDGEPRPSKRVVAI